MLCVESKVNGNPKIWAEMFGAYDLHSNPFESIIFDGNLTNWSLSNVQASWINYSVNDSLEPLKSALSKTEQKPKSNEIHSLEPFESSISFSLCLVSRSSTE